MCVCMCVLRGCLAKRVGQWRGREGRRFRKGGGGGAEKEGGREGGEEEKECVFMSVYSAALLSFSSVCIAFGGVFLGFTV